MNKTIALRTGVALAAWLLMVRVASGQGCYTSSIMNPTPFMGNNGEIFRLADGSLWEVKYEYQYLYEYYPKVTVCPSKGVLILKDKSLRIQRVASSSPLAAPGETLPATRSSESSKLELRQDDEFSFFDSAGRASAYLDLSGGLTLYLWSGDPVAYLDDESIFGFNGKHLGWYHKGVIYDHDGAVVAAPASAFREPPGPTPPRSLKGLRPLKGLKELKPLKPLFGRSWSDLPARVFLLRGID